MAKGKGGKKKQWKRNELKSHDVIIKAGEAQANDIVIP
jgi:hypothetical protein